MIVTVPLQIIDLHQDGYHPLVSVAVFGKTFKLVLDTGASKTAFDQEILSAEGINVMASDSLSTGLGTNSMTSFTTVLSDLCIGELKVSEFEVAVLDLSTINIAYRQLNHPEVLGVLGGDVLMKYKGVIDYERKVLKLKS
jgi:hypothetical protein